MPITPRSLLPVSQPSELAVGTIISSSPTTVSVELRPGVTVRLPGTGYAAGQRVVLAMPGGRVSGAQIVGPAAGSAQSVRQVVV